MCSMNRMFFVTIGIMVCIGVGVVSYVHTAVPQALESQTIVMTSEAGDEGPSIRCVPLEVVNNTTPTSDVLFSESVIPESYEWSFLKGLFASRLVDGDTLTLAYPGSTELDYLIRFSDGLHPVTGITVSWGSYGAKGTIAKWFLEGCSEDGAWTPLTSGTNVTSEEVIADFDKGLYSALRLRAEADEWIGAYELEVR